MRANKGKTEAATVNTITRFGVYTDLWCIDAGDVLSELSYLAVTISGFWYQPEIVWRSQIGFVETKSVFGSIRF